MLVRPDQEHPPISHCTNGKAAKEMGHMHEVRTQGGDTKDKQSMQAEQIRHLYSIVCRLRLCPERHIHFVSPLAELL